MKIQCPCGAKHVIELTPDMAERGVQFVCPECGLDSSLALTALARQQGTDGPPVGILLPSSDAPAQPSAPPARIEVRRPPTMRGVSAAAGASAGAAVCLKHPGERFVEKCAVCGKGICPKCMEIFGYVCSPHCKAKAEAQGLDVPEFEGQRSVAEAKHWRKVMSGAAGIAAAVLVLLGIWFWYAWIGSHPKPVYTARFEERAFSGQSQLVGKNDLIVLHGNRLSRHDLKAEKQVWRQELESDEETEFNLFVCGTNIWVAQPGKVVRYNWSTGNPEETVEAAGAFAEFSRQGDVLIQLSSAGESGPAIQRIDLLTGDVSTRSIPLPAHRLVAGAEPRAEAGAGLPTGPPGSNRREPLDPARVAEEAQRLPLAGRLALPALLAGNMSQERILDELEAEENPGPRTGGESIAPRDYVSVFPTGEGEIQFAVRLIEKRIVSRRAMKDSPARSALENANVTQSLEVANEILNDLQRMRGGDLVYEDESRYLVTVRMPGAPADFVQEVAGRPAFFPLKSVNVIAAGKSLYVLDKNNRQLWQAALSFPLPPGAGGIPSNRPELGLGPCVERDDTLYVLDPAVLAAFDLKTGNARWRLPTTGATDLFFDEEGMMYVNTTTATPDNVRFSRQIDITQPIAHVVMKMDPRSGKVIWSRRPGAPITCVTGKFIYLLRVSDAGGAFGRTPIGAIDDAAFLKIKRMHPDDGRILWEHLQQRPPLDVQFRLNSIQVVFADEVQVLRFLSL